ncbi:MAG: DUF4352 domain-containing protein [Propionibacteriaceae bacterium]
MGINKIKAALLAAALALAVAGCAPVAAESEQGDGPAVLTDGDGTESDTSETDTPETDGEPSAEEEAPAGPASFTDKYVYADGLEVEVTKITQKKLGEWDIADGMDPGDPYHLFDVRVKNGSSENVDVIGTAVVSYGADGHQAPQVYSEADIVLDGTILPGKAKTGKFGFGVPSESADDVVLEFAPDFLHDAAIFSGPIE